MEGRKNYLSFHPLLIVLLGFPLMLTFKGDSSMSNVVLDIYGFDMLKSQDLLARYPVFLLSLL